MIEIRNQSIRIHGKEMFLVGGELHYFRVRKEEWVDRLLKMKEAGCNLVSTYIPWQIHEQTEGDIDLVGRNFPQNDLASFLAIVKDMGFYCLVRPGPYVMSELTTDGIPEWLIEEHPEALAKMQDGSPHSTRIFSYMHPTYLSYVKKWYQAVFEILTPYSIENGGPIVMIQLDNEVGMFQWIVNQGDYSENTMIEFVRFLENRYPTLNELNDALKTSISSRDEVVQRIKHLEAPFALPLHHEYGLFNRHFFTQYLQTLVDYAREFGMDVPIVVNVHGFDQHDYAKRGLRYPIGLSQLKDTMRIKGAMLAGDYYIGNIVMDNYTDVVMADALTTSLQNPDQPLFSAEFQGGFQTDRPILQPTTIDLNSRLCIADGMNAINYYMFVGGYNWHDSGLFGKIHDWQAPISSEGEKRRSYYMIQHLSNILQAYSQGFMQSKPEVSTTIGWDPDMYMTEYRVDSTREFVDRLKQVRETGLYGLGRNLCFNNIPFDALDLTRNQDIDPQAHPSLLVVGSKWMNSDVQARIAKYVENGGTLAFFNEIPSLDYYGNPCTILLDTFDIHPIGSIRWSKVKHLHWDSINTTEAHLYDVAEGIMHTEKSNQPVSFIKHVKTGKVLVIGVLMDMERLFKDEVIGSLLTHANVVSPYRTHERVHISIRRNKNQKFLSILNFDEYRKVTPVFVNGKPWFDGKMITLNPRQGLLLPVEFELENEVVLEYATAELVHRTSDQLTFDIHAKEIHIALRNAYGITSDVEIETETRGNQTHITIRCNDPRQVTLHFTGGKR